MKIKIEITDSPEKTPNIIFIMDKSGSMQSIKNDTIGGFNSFVDKQKAQGGAAHLNVILFDTVTSTYYKGAVSEVPSMNGTTYSPDGMTALYDAIGKTLTEYSHYQKALVVILTDGEENSSRSYTKSQILEMIKSREATGWEFLYLGANQDAFAEGSKIGIHTTLNFLATDAGIRNAFSNVTTYATAYRGTGTITGVTVDDD